MLLLSLRRAPTTLTQRLYASTSAKPFGYVYDERMLKHTCPYDPTMAEKPERIKLIYERLVKEGQLEKAVRVPARPATDEELMLNHPKALIKKFEELRTSEECEDYCRSKEILWLGPESLPAARLSAGSSIDIVKANVEGRIGNGLAIVRPPGHHSYGETPQGYCLFNNVAIAAKYAVEKLGLKKVAIVDFDYHAGNGTFHSVKDDNRIHFTSFHAHHHGAFWPFERAFDYDTTKNQLFFPLNAAMNTEAGFLSAFHHVLLPVLREWAPDMILVSAGFDAGYYDLDQLMGQAVKAHGFGHMARQLNEICPDRTVAILEGGYFPHNYVESAHMFVRGLQGAPLPAFSYPERVDAPLRETILNLIHHHASNWRCMKQQLERVQQQQRQLGLPEYDPATSLFLGADTRPFWNKVVNAGGARTREWFPDLTPEMKSIAIEKIDAVKREYDYSRVCPTPAEGALVEQLVWDENARAESYRQTVQSCLPMCQTNDDIRTGKIPHFLILEWETIIKKFFPLGRLDK